MAPRSGCASLEAVASERGRRRRPRRSSPRLPTEAARASRRAPKDRNGPGSVDGPLRESIKRLHGPENHRRGAKPSRMRAGAIAMAPCHGCASFTAVATGRELRRRRSWASPRPRTTAARASQRSPRSGEGSDPFRGQVHGSIPRLRRLHGDRHGSKQRRIRLAADAVDPESDSPSAGRTPGTQDSAGFVPWLPPQVPTSAIQISWRSPQLETAQYRYRGGRDGDSEERSDARALTQEPPHRILLR